jgi:hypothetical protein
MHGAMCGQAACQLITRYLVWMLQKYIEGRVLISRYHVQLFHHKVDCVGNLRQKRALIQRLHNNSTEGEGRHDAEGKAAGCQHWHCLDERLCADKSVAHDQTRHAGGEKGGEVCGDVAPEAATNEVDAG